MELSRQSLEKRDGHYHQLTMGCGEAELLMEICHIAHDSGKLGSGAQRIVKELWHNLSEQVKPSFEH